MMEPVGPSGFFCMRRSANCAVSMAPVRFTATIRFQSSNVTDSTLPSPCNDACTGEHDIQPPVTFNDRSGEGWQRSAFSNALRIELRARFRLNAHLLGRVA